jgi:hypothetical protein
MLGELIPLLAVGEGAAAITSSVLEAMGWLLEGEEDFVLGGCLDSWILEFVDDIVVIGTRG